MSVAVAVAVAVAVVLAPVEGEALAGVDADKTSVDDPVFDPVPVAAAVALLLLLLLSFRVVVGVVGADSGFSCSSPIRFLMALGGG